MKQINKHTAILDFFANADLALLTIFIINDVKFIIDL